MPLYIDSTMLTCARSCLEKFRLEFVYGLRPSGLSVDLHAGGAFAAATEAFRKAVFGSGKPVDEALQLAHAAFAVYWGDFEIPDGKKTAKTFDGTWQAFENYANKFPPLTDHVKPYYVNGKPTFEFTFAVPLEPAVYPFTKGTMESYDPDDHPGEFPLHPSGEPWLYSGRFDLLGQYMGRPCVLDDKTTGRSISSGWAEQWNLRNQFMGYVWACQQSGLDLDTVVIRGIAILKTMTNFAEAIKVYSDDKVARWHEQLRRDLWRIRRAWDTGYFDYNFADSCTSFGNCIFMPVCEASDANKSNWMNDYEVRRWNPLAKNPVNPQPEVSIFPGQDAASL